MDGLLKYGFSQDPSGTNNNNKGVFHSGKSEDFFYIKVSQKPKPGHHRNAEAEDRDRASLDTDAGRKTPPELIPMSGKLEKVTTQSQKMTKTFRLLSFFIYFNTFFSLISGKHVIK